MRCAKAYSSSCSQIALVCLQPFRCNSLLKCAAQPRIAKKTMKPLIFGVQGLSKSTMLTWLKSSSVGLVVIGSISMPICNCFHGKLANNSQITTFMGYRSLMPSSADFLKPRRSRLGPLKSTFNAENFICSLSWSICSEFGAIRSWNVSHSSKSPKNP